MLKERRENGGYNGNYRKYIYSIRYIKIIHSGQINPMYKYALRTVMLYGQLCLVNY